MRKFARALFSLVLGTVLGLGLPFIFLAIAQGRDGITRGAPLPPSPAPAPVQEDILSPPEWVGLDRYSVSRTASVVDVATTTLTVENGAVLTTLIPLTTTVYVPAGAVTSPLTLTLSSLAVPSFPPTSPWVVWGGRAFSLTAQREGQVIGSRALSTPFTVTVDFYGAQGYRWMLMHWVSPTWEMAGCARQTGKVTPDRIELVVCNGLGEYAVTAAPDTWCLPIIRRGAR